MKSVDEYLTLAFRQGASDVHLTAGYKPLMRKHGDLVPLDDTVLDAAELSDALLAMLTEEHRQYFQSEYELDYAYEMAGLSRFRVNLFQQMRGIGGAFRTIPIKILTLAELRMPEGVYDLTRLKKGLVVVTGPTGSGKSTTLAAMVDRINSERHDHILTIEDPVEYTHKPKNCLVNQRELGIHTRSFAGALRSALREDPDVILVGEMRDLETISLAITAAETGHLVFGTLHTKSAAETVDRIIDVFPGDQQQQIRTMLANTLEGVVAQRLLKKADGQGRVAVDEILMATPAVRNLIRENKTHQINSAIQMGGQYHMQTMDRALREAVGRGDITKEQALLEANDRSIFT